MILTDRRNRATPIRWRNFAALGWMLVLPATAEAQSFSPGDLVVTAPPTLSGPTINSILGAPPLTTGPGVSPPDFQYLAYGDLSERFTTNAQGGSGGSSDFDSRAAVGVVGTYTTARLDASLAYNGALDYFARSAGNVVFTNNLNANGIVDILPDHLNLSADAFIAPVYSTGLGNVAPAGQVLPPGANSDFTNTYGFDVSPDFYFRLGDFVRSDTLPTYSETFISQPVGAGATLLPGIGGNIETKALTQRVTTGDFFSQLEFSAIANYTETDRNNFDFIQRSATGEASYAITHDLAIVGDGGYQTVKANIPLNDDLSGPVLLGGFRLDGPYLTGQVLAGEQYRSFSVVGNLNYMITSLLTLTAVATDNVTTPGATQIGAQQGTNGPLSGILAGIASGQIQVPASGILALDQNTLAGIGLESTISRIRAQTVGIQYGLGQLTAALSGGASEQSNVAGTLAGQNANLQTIGITASLNYALSEDLTAGGDFSYTTQNLSVGSDGSEQFDLHADWTIGDKTRLYGEFTFFNRDSNAKLAAFSAGSGSFSSESIQIGIRRQF